MADMIQNPGDNADMLKPYEVKVEAPGQSASQQQEQTPEQKPEQKTEQKTEQTPAHSAKTEPMSPNRIDWVNIEQQWGIKRDDLEMLKNSEINLFEVAMWRLGIVAPFFTPAISIFCIGRRPRTKKKPLKISRSQRFASV